MKKIFLMLGFMAVVLIAACTKTETTSSEPTATLAPSTAAVEQKIVVGLDDSFPPMGFRAKNNELVGFDIDLAREVAKRIGYEFVFQPIDWGAKESELNSKRVDVLWNGLTITAKRKQNIAFSQPYMENHQIIVVRVNDSIASKADLAAKVVGVQDASSAVEAIEKEAEVAASFKELRKYADNVTALSDLTIGRVDAVVVDEVVGRYYVSNEADKYKVLEDNFGTEEYGVGFRKDATELIEQVNTALSEMKQDGTAAKISQQWFGADVTK